MQSLPIKFKTQYRNRPELNITKVHKQKSKISIFSEEETTKYQSSVTHKDYSTLSFSEKNGGAQGHSKRFLWTMAQMSLFSGKKKISSDAEICFQKKFSSQTWKNLKRPVIKKNRKDSRKKNSKEIQNNFWSSRNLMKEIESQFFVTKPKKFDNTVFNLKAVAIFNFEKCLKFFVENPTLHKRLKQFKQYISQPIRNQERKSWSSSRYRACQVEGFYLKTNLLRMRKDYSKIFLKKGNLEEKNFVGFVGDRVKKVSFLVVFEYKKNEIFEVDKEVIEVKSEEVCVSIEEEEKLGKRGENDAKSCKAFMKKVGFRPVKKLKRCEQGKKISKKPDLIFLENYDEWLKKKLAGLGKVVRKVENC